MVVPGVLLLMKNATYNGISIKFIPFRQFHLMSGNEMNAGEHITCRV